MKHEWINTLGGQVVKAMADEIYKDYQNLLRVARAAKAVVDLNHWDPDLDRELEAALKEVEDLL